MNNPNSYSAKGDEKKCRCGAMCVPGTQWCFVCNPAYPADARERYFATVSPYDLQGDKEYPGE